MHKKYLVIVFVAALCAAMIFCTACSDSRAEEVRLYNEHTEQTLTEHLALQQQLAGKEIMIIEAIRDNSIDIQYLNDAGLSLAAESEMLRKATIEGIDSTPLIIDSGIFTSLGANSNTQIIQFSIVNTQFVLEILWVNQKIDTLSLEEVAS